MEALAILLKLKCYALAQLQDKYTTDDNEYDQLLLESYINPEVIRAKGGTKNAKTLGR